MPVSFADGRPAAAGLFTLSTDKVVVPAGGSAEVSVTLDGSVLGTEGAYGGYNGLLSARDDSGAIRLSLGIHGFVDAPELSPCMGDVVGSNQAACRPEPLIFLRYDFDLALDNTVKAGETHEITVVGYAVARLRGVLTTSPRSPKQVALLQPARQTTSRASTSPISKHFHGVSLRERNL
ncbi:hypothetical protein [Streptomyces sp. NPDC001070]